MTQSTTSTMNERFGTIIKSTGHTVYIRNCPIQISAVTVTELYKPIDSPSSGSATMPKLPRKDNHVCKSKVQPICSRN